MTALKPWVSGEAVTIPASARSGEELLGYSQQLTKADVRQIEQAYKAGSFEMLSTFVWTKAMAALKKQLSELGMDFLGELLGRNDLSDDDLPDHVISDFDAIRLAGELAMITATDAMRLRTVQNMILHFTRRPDEGEMAHEEAILCLRACLQSILAQPKSEGALRFKEFRRKLEAHIFEKSDSQVQSLLDAPYFFQRTTLSVLLALAKTRKSAQLENVLGNLSVLLPLLWEGLREPERWQVGNTYAEVFANGDERTAASLKKALLRTQGFDYVPESLRSSTFIRAARKVIDMHLGYDNFRTEPEAIKILARLGTSIPMPAFPLCMSATLCVKLGNYYGHSYDAQQYADEILRSLTTDRWQYFIEQCLPGDAVLLEKLAEEIRPRKRWMELCAKLDDVTLTKPKPKKLLTASRAKDDTRTAATAKAMWSELSGLL